MVRGARGWLCSAGGIRWLESSAAHLPSPLNAINSQLSISFIYRDEHRGFQLFQSDPSGNYSGWKATSIGGNHQAAANVLQGEYEEGLSLEAAVKLTIRVLSKTMDSATLTTDKIELATLSLDSDGNPVHTIFERDQMSPILEAVAAEQAAEKEREAQAAERSRQNN